MKIWRLNLYFLIYMNIFVQREENVHRGPLFEAYLDIVESQQINERTLWAVYWNLDSAIQYECELRKLSYIQNSNSLVYFIFIKMVQYLMKPIKLLVHDTKSLTSL